MGTPNWAHRGFDRPSSGSSKQRFWLPKGTEKQVVMISELPFSFWEHSLRGTGKQWHEYWTCIRNVDPRGCPICEHDNAYYIGLVTCIDTSKWTRRDGKVVSNQKRLLPLRGQMLQFFEKLRGKAGGQLRGAVFSVSRGEWDKAPVIGDRWDLVKVLSESELAGKFGSELITEFDYQDIVAPKSYEMVQQRSEFITTKEDDDNNSNKQDSFATNTKSVSSLVDAMGDGKSSGNDSSPSDEESIPF